MTTPYTSGPYPYRVLVQTHAHTTASDGNRTAQQVVDQYANAGYDGVALTDHDLVTSQPSGISCPITGNELSGAGHVLSLGSDYTRGSETDPQAWITAVLADGGVPVIAHPNWPVSPTSPELLKALNGYVGVEVHNALCVGHPNAVSFGLAVDLWDTLLRTVRRDLWGFAADDFHEVTNRAGYDIGRLIVWPLELSAAGILAAIKRGDFAADVSNHGVTLNPPVLDESYPATIELTCPGATRIRFVTELGPQPWIDGAAAIYEIGGCEWYVRAEVVGAYTEGFDTAIDTANRWGVKGGNWAVSAGRLQQQQDTVAEQQILLKRHLTGDWSASVDVELPSNGSEEQVGLLVNALNHEHGYLWCLRGDSGSIPNTLSFWVKTNNAWTFLESVPFTPSAGTIYRLKATYDAASATFTGACWDAAGTEPSPQITRVHTAYRHGAIGLRTRRKGWFDNLSVEGFTSYFQPMPIRS